MVTIDVVIGVLAVVVLVEEDEVLGVVVDVPDAVVIPGVLTVELGLLTVEDLDVVMKVVGELVGVEVMIGVVDCTVVVAVVVIGVRVVTDIVVVVAPVFARLPRPFLMV